jgi:N-acetylneuraminic acid mutarotase
MRSFGGVGTTCQNRHFAGTGFRAYSLSWWGEFLPEGAWVKRKNVPGYKRTTAACTATKDFVYVIGGMHFGGVNTDGKVLSDIQQYNPSTDNWQYVGNLPDGGRMNHIAFSVGNRVYVGLGENEDIQVCGDLYCIYEK